MNKGILSFHHRLRGTLHNQSPYQKTLKMRLLVELLGAADFVELFSLRR
ncbi:hypothetical protein A2U01_0089539, partial [Trifolium medium]|nr:hypothetical protein [Trifolium medium]